MSAELPLQQAVFTRLNGDATLGTLIDGVYDHVPDKTQPAYVVIGDDALNEWGTMGTNGANAEITVHTWTQGTGFKGAKTIMARIYLLLHKYNLSVSGYTTAGMLAEFSDVFKEADNRTNHGVQRFRIWLREV